MSKSENNQNGGDGSVKSSILLGIKSCPLHMRTPFGFKNVSMTNMSIARHTGGISYNGEQYTYMPMTDELIRDDVLNFLIKQDTKYLQSDVERVKRETSQTELTFN